MGRDNSRVRERFELSLDGKQVAAVVVGALVLMGAVFVLGLNVGKQLGAKAVPPARPDNPLAALDQARAPEPAEGREPKFGFHRALTEGPPDSAPLPEVTPPALPAPRPPPPSTVATGTALDATAPAPSPPAPAGVQAPAPRPPAPPRPRTAPPAAPRQDPVAAAVARVQAMPGGAAAGGRFSIQVGATRSEAEARRLANKHEAEGARVVAGEMPGKGRIYRVKLGSFPTRAEAEQRLASLARVGVKGFVTDAR